MPLASNWHPEDIKAAIRKRGRSLAEIARDLGVTASAVSSTMRYANRRSFRIEQAIAEAAGIPAAELWPARYQPTTDIDQAA